MLYSLYLNTFSLLYLVENLGSITGFLAPNYPLNMYAYLI
jgi:hypothetical protein